MLRCTGTNLGRKVICSNFFVDILVNRHFEKIFDKDSLSSLTKILRIGVIHEDIKLLVWTIHFRYLIVSINSYNGLYEPICLNILGTFFILVFFRKREIYVWISRRAAPDSEQWRGAELRSTSHSQRSGSTEAMDVLLYGRSFSVFCGI